MIILRLYVRLFILLMFYAPGRLTREIYNLFGAVPDTEIPVPAHDPGEPEFSRSFFKRNNEDLLERRVNNLSGILAIIPFFAPAPTSAHPENRGEKKPAVLQV
jgi:hypothetical protein